LNSVLDSIRWTVDWNLSSSPDIDTRRDRRPDIDTRRDRRPERHRHTDGRHTDSDTGWRLHTREGGALGTAVLTSTDDAPGTTQPSPTVGMPQGRHP